MKQAQKRVAPSPPSEEDAKSVGGANKKQKVSPNDDAVAPQNNDSKEPKVPPAATVATAMSSAQKDNLEALRTSDASQLEVLVNSQLSTPQGNPNGNISFIQKVQVKETGTTSNEPPSKNIVTSSIPIVKLPEQESVSLLTPNKKNPPHNVLLERASLIDKHDVLLNDKHATKYSSGSILWLDAKKRERTDALASNCTRSLAQRFHRVQEIFRLSLPSGCTTPRFWCKLNDSEINQSLNSDKNMKLGKVQGYKGIYIEKTKDDEEIRHNVNSFRLSKTSLHPSSRSLQLQGRTISNSSNKASKGTPVSKNNSELAATETPTASEQKEIGSPQLLASKQDQDAGGPPESALQQCTILDVLESHWNPHAVIKMSAGELARCLIMNANLTAAASIKRVINLYPQASQSDVDNNLAVAKKGESLDTPVDVPLPSTTPQDTETPPKAPPAETGTPVDGNITTPSSAAPGAKTPGTEQTAANDKKISSGASPTIIHDWDILLNDKHATKYSQGSELWGVAKADERGELMRRNLVEKRARVQEIFERRLKELYNLDRRPIFWYKMINRDHSIADMQLGQIKGRETNSYRRATEEEICKNVKSYRGTNRTTNSVPHSNLINSGMKFPVPAPQDAPKFKVENNVEIPKPATGTDSKQNIAGAQGQPFSSKTGDKVKEVRMSTYTHPNGKNVFMESIQLLFSDGTSTERFGGIPETAGAGSQVKKMSFEVDDSDAIVKAQVSSSRGTHGVQFTTKKGTVSSWFGSNCGPNTATYTGLDDQELLGITGCSGWLLDKLEFKFGQAQAMVPFEGEKSVSI